MRAFSWEMVTVLIRLFLLLYKSWDVLSKANSHNSHHCNSALQLYQWECYDSFRELMCHSDYCIRFVLRRPGFNSPFSHDLRLVIFNIAYLKKRRTMYGAPWKKGRIKILLKRVVTRGRGWEDAEVVSSALWWFCHPTWLINNIIPFITCRVFCMIDFKSKNKNTMWHLLWYECVDSLA